MNCGSGVVVPAGVRERSLLANRDFEEWDALGVDG